MKWKSITPIISVIYIIYLIELTLCSPLKYNKKQSLSIQRAISQGKVYCKEQWITEKEKNQLRDLCFSLQEEDCFHTSGLSYVSSTHNNNSTIVERLVCEEIPTHHLDNKALNMVIEKIDDLRIELSTILDRPTMKDGSLQHESYLSLSPCGSSLQRHMDERHEELKTTKLKSRRSISWLLYLNDNQWSKSNGGHLRYFPQRKAMYPTRYGSCGCHTGNLQIGWLEHEKYVKPVYMQSWASDSRENNRTESRIKSALYVLSFFKRKLFITDNFIASNVDHSRSDENINHDDTIYSALSVNEEEDKPLNFFIKCIKHLKSDVSQAIDNKSCLFSLIENYDLWMSDERGDGGQMSISLSPIGTKAFEVAPLGGTLCLFDSVSLPHEVLQTVGGKRVALAGWFHELVVPPVVRAPDDIRDGRDDNHNDDDEKQHSKNNENSGATPSLYRPSLSSSPLPQSKQLQSSSKLLVSAYKAMSYNTRKV